jgi:hypothetical protein
MTELSDGERAVLLTPCGCGHSINDHGSLIACWRCEDDGSGDCSASFESLLVERVAVIVAAASPVAALADQWEASLAESFHTEGEAAIVRTHVAQLRAIGGV